MLESQVKQKNKNFFNNKNDYCGFVYIPKTGGTYLSMSPIPERYHGEEYRESGLGHSFHMPVSKVVKIVGEETPLFTMVRNPYDRACSEYYFIQREIRGRLKYLNWKFLDENKLEFIAKRIKTFMNSDFYYEKVVAIFKNNFTIEEYLEWYCENPSYPYYYDEKTPKEFDAVGITEDIPGTIMLLKNLYNIDIFQGHSNDNPNKIINQPYTTKYSRDAFQQQNNIEYNIYYEGKEKYYELINQTKTH